MKNGLTVLLCLITIAIYGQHLDVEGDARIVGKLNLMHSLSDSSIFIGAEAGKHARTDLNQRNTMVGTQSGRSLFEGPDNSFFGYYTGRSNDLGRSNAFFGSRAGQSNTTGQENAFFGYKSGQSNINGHLNAFFGCRAGELNTTGFNNAFFGNQAGQSNINGIQNAFFGHNAGQSNSSGFQNAFFGTDAGAANRTGDQNAFFGNQAGQANTTSNRNAFFGDQAGKSNITGGENAFFGTESGRANTTGHNNAFFGHMVGHSNTIGNNNAFFGTQSGESNTTGARNVIIGTLAGLKNDQGNQNTFVGNNAGRNNINGHQNTALGCEADFPFESSLVKAISIGYNAQVNCSNCAVIGGTGPDAVKVGIGTTTPDRELTIVADGGSVISVRSSTTPLNEVILGVNASNGGWMRTVTDTDLSLWTNSLKRLTIRNTGEVQIHKLGIAGNQQLCLNASGELAPCSSSRRYKDNIHDYQPDVTPLEAFRPVTYEWKDSGQKDIGLIAEEVALIDPRLVTYNDAGQVEGVKYDRLGVLLIDVIQQQEQEMQLHKQAIDRLQKAVETLQSNTP